MRITGGTAKNRKLTTPGKGNKKTVRPTSDRVREALFSILGERVQDSRVLDLFTGTGALGLEALSRGASMAVFVDSSPLSLEIVRKNLQACFTEVRAEILRLNLARESSYFTLSRRFAGQERFNIVFMDPPYEKKLAETALTMVEKTQLLAQRGLLVVEERWNTSLPDRSGCLILKQQRRYGETGIWIYAFSQP